MQLKSKMTITSILVLLSLDALLPAPTASQSGDTTQKQASPADSRDVISTLWKLLAPMRVQCRSIVTYRCVAHWRMGTCVAYLDTTDTSQQCPSAWTLITTPRRTCGRSTNAGSCVSAIFPSNGIRYSHICGRVTGYQDRSPDGFQNFLTNSTTDIDSYYLDGVSVTHGTTETCECALNNPPWFCKRLAQATTDDIEVRICSDESLANEDTPVELIELYVR